MVGLVVKFLFVMDLLQMILHLFALEEELVLLLMFALDAQPDGLELVVNKQSVLELEQMRPEFVFHVVLVYYQILALALVDISEICVNSLVVLEN